MPSVSTLSKEQSYRKKRNKVYDYIERWEQLSQKEGADFKSQEFFKPPPSINCSTTSTILSMSKD